MLQKRVKLGLELGRGRGPGWGTKHWVAYTAHSLAGMKTSALSIYSIVMSVLYVRIYSVLISQIYTRKPPRDLFFLALSVCYCSECVVPLQNMSNFRASEPQSCDHPDWAVQDKHMIVRVMSDLLSYRVK